MREFLRYRFWDWLLCGCIATGLVFPLFAGFVLEDRFSASILLVALFMAAAMAVMVLFSWSRVTAVTGIVIGAALLVFVMVYVRVNGVFADEASEASNSLFVALTVAVLTAVLVYLACRTRPGIIALFLAGNILICGSVFLQFEVHVWSFLLFDFCVLIMLWYRNYLSSLSQAQTGKIRLPRFMAQSLVICLAALVVGCGAWYGIIRPLDPPTRELKLIQQLQQMTIVRQMGLYSTQEYLDPSLRSSADTDQREEGADEETQQQEDPEETQEDIPEGGVQNQTPPQAAQAVYYMLNLYRVPLILMIAAVLIAAAFILRILVRRNWKKKTDLLAPEQQIIQYYTYFLTRLERTGIRRPANHTLYEFASDMDHTLQEFSVGEANFTRLTELYVRSFYSRNAASDAEAELFRSFYGIFHKALRREIGVFKYLINIFRI